MLQRKSNPHPVNFSVNFIRCDGDPDRNAVDFIVHSYLHFYPELITP